MNDIIGNDDDQQGRLTMGRLWNRIVCLEDVRPIRHIGAAIFVRSAQLVGAVGCGILHHLYKELPIPSQTIAIDGSVLKHVRGALVMMEDAMQACQNEGPDREKTDFHRSDSHPGRGLRRRCDCGCYEHKIVFIRKYPDLPRNRRLSPFSGGAFFGTI